MTAVVKDIFFAIALASVSDYAQCRAASPNPSIADAWSEFRYRL
jgi:hypothetical protein